MLTMQLPTTKCGSEKVTNIDMETETHPSQRQTHGDSPETDTRRPTRHKQRHMETHQRQAHGGTRRLTRHRDRHMETHPSQRQTHGDSPVTKTDTWRLTHHKQRQTHGDSPVTKTDTWRLTRHKQRIVWWFDLLVTSGKDRALESVVTALNFHDKANNTYLFTQSLNSNAILSSTSTRAARSTNSNPSTRLLSPLSTANCITPQQDCNGGTQPFPPNCASTSLASALFFSILLTSL